jgi:anti-sigma B factor antagonist
MDSCFQALVGSDRTLHGTALEYLENVLPDEIRILLWRHIEGTATITRSNRDQQELADSLLLSGRDTQPAEHTDTQQQKSEPTPPKKHTVISLHGEIDLAVAPMISKQFLEILGEGKNLVVDFSQVSYIDSSGISSLVQGHQYAQEHGLEFALAGLGEIPMRVLELCHMDKVFTIYKSPTTQE